MDGISSYIPATILSYILDNIDDLTKDGPVDAKGLSPSFKPIHDQFETAVLFADVSGYTKLCERMAAKGLTGDEQLARTLNSYFEQLLKVISSNGGDVFKFAGDALLVLWPPSDENTLQKTRRAAQCAVDIREKLSETKLHEDVILSVTVGVGVGTVSVLHVGGIYKRMEYLAVGDALVQAFHAEHEASADKPVVSAEAWELIEDYFEATCKDGHAFLAKCTDPLRKLSVFKTMAVKARKLKKDKRVFQAVQRYVPAAVMPFVDTAGEKWASEVRRITVLFVNLGLGMMKGGDDDIDTIQRVLSSVQRSVYRYEGSLNKFLMDDKGSTLIAVFGLPPLAHEDDAVRGVLCSLSVCAQLHELGFTPSVGITTGRAFCGVVGSRGRREYSVLGDTVNLSARLMQHASKNGGGVLCDNDTQYLARGRLTFETLDPIRVKGKSLPIEIFNPYPKELAEMFTTKGRTSVKRAPPPTPTAVAAASVKGSVRSTVDRRRPSVELGNALYAAQGARRRVKSILSIFDTFFNPDGDESKESLNAKDLERAIRRSVDKAPPRASAIITPLTAPVVEEMQEDELKDAESAYHGKKDSGDFVRSQNLINQLERMQTQGYNQQHFAKVQAGRQRLSPGTSFNAGTGAGSARQSRQVRGSTRDALMGAVLHKRERKSLKVTGQTSLLPMSSSHGGSDDSGSDTDDSATDVATGSKSLTIKLPGAAPDEEDDDVNLSAVKAVRVMLPGQKGHITVQCFGIKTVSQLKQTVWERLTQRQLLDADAVKQDYCLLFAGTNIGLPDVFEMSVIVSILNTHDLPVSPVVELQLVHLDVARGAWYSTDAANDIQEEDLELPSARPSVSVVSSSTTGSTDELAVPTTKSSSHGSFSVLVNDVAVDPAESLGIDTPQAKTAVRTSEDQRRMDQMVQIDQRLRMLVTKLSKDRQGGTVIVEGDIGLGKSQLLNNTVFKAPQRCLLVCGAGNPFEMSRPLSVWRDIFLQAVDSELGREPSRLYSGDRIEQRLQWIRYRLRERSTGFSTAEQYARNRKYAQWKAAQQSLASVAEEEEEDLESQSEVGQPASAAPVTRATSNFSPPKTRDSVLKEPPEPVSADPMEALVPVLNDVLHLQVEETPETASLTKVQRHQTAVQLLMLLLDMIVEARPTIIVLEDAVFLDALSWRLALRISKELCTFKNRGLLLVLATRPINKAYMAAFTTGIPEEYLEMIQDPNNCYITLCPRPDEVIYQMACDALQVAQIPPYLAALILQKSNGNPQVVKEFVYALKNDGLVKVDLATHTCLLSKKLQFMDLKDLVTTLNVPVPITLQATLGTQLDRLTTSQRMILKVAAVMGEEFTADLIFSAYPLANKNADKLAAEVKSMAELGIIREVVSHDVIPTGSSSVPATLASVQEHSADQTGMGPSKLADIKAGKVTYAFTHGFMRDMVLSRMLEEQKHRLTNIVSKVLSDVFRKNDGDLAQSNVCNSKGILFVREGSNPDASWDRRFCVLTDKCLCVYFGETHYNRKAAERTPLRVLVLAGAEMSRVDAQNKDVCARLTVKKWIQYPDVEQASGQAASAGTGRFMISDKEFFFASNDKAVFLTWCRQVHSVIVQSLPPHRRHFRALARKTQIWKQQRIMLGLELQEPARQQDDAKLELTQAERKQAESQFRAAVLSVESTQSLNGLLVEKVEVRKQVGFLFTDWKTRFITLTPDALFLRKKQRPSFAKNPAEQDPKTANTSHTDVIALNTGNVVVSLDGYDKKHKFYLLKINCDLWMKRLHVTWKKRDFVFGVHSEEAARRCQEQIQRVADYHRTNFLASKRSSKIKKLGTMHSRNDRLAAASRSVFVANGSIQTLMERELSKTRGTSASVSHTRRDNK